jgi:hypothetical protein
MSAGLVVTLRVALHTGMQPNNHSDKDFNTMLTSMPTCNPGARAQCQPAAAAMKGS